MSLDLDGYLGAFPKAMLIHSKRAEIIAGNIANQDTPGYKARDIDFKAALKSIEATTDATKGISITNGGHIPSDGLTAMSEIKYRIPNQPSLDGNTVDGQIEQMEYVDNSMRYMANLTFLEGKLNSLMLAIKGSR